MSKAPSGHFCSKASGCDEFPRSAVTNVGKRPASVGKARSLAGGYRPFWDIARAREQSLRIAGADILGREVDSTRLLLAFEYEDVWRRAARNARGYREGLEIGRKFVLLRQCDLAFGPLNHFKGARAEASR